MLCAHLGAVSLASAHLGAVSLACIFPETGSHCIAKDGIGLTASGSRSSCFSLLNAGTGRCVPLYPEKSRFLSFCVIMLCALLPPLHPTDTTGAEIKTSQQTLRMITPDRGGRTEPEKLSAGALMRCTQLLKVDSVFQRRGAAPRTSRITYEVPWPSTPLPGIVKNSDKDQWVSSDHNWLSLQETQTDHVAETTGSPVAHTTALNRE